MNNLSIRLFAAVITIALMPFSLLQSQVVFVTPSGAGTMDGSSWANALDGNTPAGNGYTRLADALKSAVPGVRFWIAEGTFRVCTDNDREKSFELKQNIRLYGGFDGTEADTLQRNISLHPTVFSGDIGLVGDSTDNTKIILKTISVPWTIYAHIDGIDFKGAFNTAGNAVGTGIYNTGLLAVRNCSFKNNYTAYYGAGIHNVRDLIVEKCLFFNNKAYTGGGLYNYFSNTAIPVPTVLIKSSTFSNNTGSYSGGGIRNQGIMKIINSLIVNNTAEQPINGSGIYAMSASGSNSVATRIYNSTIANNTGYNISVWMGKLTLVNSIVWGAPISLQSNPSTDIRYSTIQGFTGNPLVNNSDPRFLNPTSGTGTIVNGLSADWSLRWCSPAIDAGADSLVPAGITTDIEGNQRVRYTAVDQGAYEFDTTGVFRNIIGFANSRIYVSDSNVYTGNGSSWNSAVAGNAESCKYSGQSMLYETMKDAPSGKEIWIKKGSYVCSLTNNRNHAFTIGNGAKIFGGFEGNEVAVGERGSGITVFSGEIGLPGVSTDNALHVFNINPDGAIYSDSARADGITVMNGYAGTAEGAGILVNSNSKIKFSNLNVKSNYSTGNGSGVSVKTLARVTISNSAIRSNTGHGIYNAGRLSLINCTVKTNTSTGVFSADSLWLNNCNIDSNNASGIVSSGYCSVNGGSVSGNLAPAKGGGIRNVTGAKMVVSACNISANGSNSVGGGLCNEGILELRACNISNNTAKDNGGGISNAAGANCLITRSDITYNKAILGFSPAGGGGVYNSGTFSIETSRICNNQTSGYGGGIFNPTKVVSCIVANNAKTNVYRTGGGLFISSGCQGIFNTTVANNTGEGICSSTMDGWGHLVVNPDTFQIKNAIVYGNDIQLEGKFNVSHSCLPQLQTGDSNIFGNPFWVNPTMSRGVADNGFLADWGLKNYSPCINSGDNAFLSGSDTTDALGNARVMFGTVDMGAAESLQPPVDTVPVNNTVVWEIFKPRPSNIQMTADECWHTVVLDRLETSPGSSDLTTQSRIRGLLLPPITGYYKFYMISDRGGRFYLSTDTTEFRVALRCSNENGSTSWPATLGNTDSVYLESGKSYYFETFCQYQYSAYPQNYLKIGWTLPGSNSLQLITGANFRQADQKQTYSLNWEVFKNVTSYDFSELKNTNNIPDDVVKLDSIIVSDHSTTLDHFASRIRGYLIPPVSGDYSFYFAAADQGRFWLSSDTSEANAQLKSEINWSQTDWAQNISGQTLIAGQKYFFEIVQYDTTFTDLVKLGWVIPGTTTPVVIKKPHVMSYHRDVPIISFSMIDREITAFPAWQIAPRFHYTPWNAAFRNPQRIHWSSTHDAIASVSSSGVITVVSPGTCRIIAKVAGDTTLTDTVVVTVTNDYGPWFVRRDADETGSGHSWGDAITLTKLLDNLNRGTLAQQVHICVAAGTYKPTTTIDRNKTFLFDNVRIVGGYPPTVAGTDTANRDVSLYETILSGEINNPVDKFDNSYHVVVAKHQTVIDGFTISDGMANCSNYGYPSTTGYPRSEDNGGGLYIPATKSNVFVTNCKLTKNLAMNKGGGVFCMRASVDINQSSVMTIHNSTFVDNEMSPFVIGGTIFGVQINGHGAGLGINTSTLNMKNCDFHHNTTINGYGKAIYIENSIANIENTTIHDNIGNYEDLWINSGYTLNFVNSTLKGSFVTFFYSTSNIIRSTITGGGYTGSSGCQVNFDNSIWTNPNLNLPSGSAWQAKYSILGSSLYGTSKNEVLSNAVQGYASWLDTLAFNGGLTPTMRLKNIPDNPAKIHGNPEFLGMTDQRGYTRSDTVSIGAYQWVWPSSITITPDQANMAPGDSLAYTVAVLPETADDKSWSVTNSDSTIASAGGSFLHAKTMGSALITVCTREANRRDTCYVTVMNDSTNATGVIASYGSECYDALNTLRVAGGGNQFIVQNGGSAEMIAGERILFLSGTKVEQGGFLHGFIAPQGPWCGNTKELVENSYDPGPSSGWFVKASPNPTRGTLHLNFNNIDLKEPVRFTVFNLFGEKVYSGEVTGVREATVSLDDLQVGMYVLHVVHGAASDKIKVIRI